MGKRLSSCNTVIKIKKKQCKYTYNWMSQALSFVLRHKVKLQNLDRDETLKKKTCFKDNHTISSNETTTEQPFNT